MKLILTNGYPYPYPDNLTEAEQDTLSERAASERIELAGVLCFQWLHTVTVEFTSDEAVEKAREVTGWTDWSPDVLEAKTNNGDGYDHPAIIAGDKAYCGFMLVGDYA